MCTLNWSCLPDGDLLIPSISESTVAWFAHVTEAQEKRQFLPLTYVKDHQMKNLPHSVHLLPLLHSFQLGCWVRGIDEAVESCCGISRAFISTSHNQISLCALPGCPITRFSHLSPFPAQRVWCFLQLPAKVSTTQ